MSTKNLENYNRHKVKVSNSFLDTQDMNIFVRNAISNADVGNCHPINAIYRYKQLQHIDEAVLIFGLGVKPFLVNFYVASYNTVTKMAYIERDEDTIESVMDLDEFLSKISSSLILTLGLTYDEICQVNRANLNGNYIINYGFVPTNINTNYLMFHEGYEIKDNVLESPGMIMNLQDFSHGKLYHELDLYNLHLVRIVEGPAEQINEIRDEYKIHEGNYIISEDQFYLTVSCLLEGKEYKVPQTVMDVVRNNMQKQHNRTGVNYLTLIDYEMRMRSIYLPINVLKIICQYNKIQLDQIGDFIQKDIDIMEGICWSTLCDKEADVAMDIKHMVKLKSNDTLSNICGNIISMMVEDFNQIAHKMDTLAAGTQNYDFNRRRLAEQLSDDDILKLLTANDKNIQKFLNHKTTHPPSEFFDQYLTYCRFYAILHKDKEVEGNKCHIFQFTKFLNSYRGEVHFNEFIIKNAYPKIKPKQALMNILRIQILSNVQLIDMPCTCGDKVHKLRQVLPIPVAHKDQVIIYNACMITTFAAFKRQLKKVTLPDPNVLTQYYEFCRNFFKERIQPILDQEYDYSVCQWFNHNPAGKQAKLKNALEDYNKNLHDKECLKVIHDLFCKPEKQPIGGKNRAISAIREIVKYITGPVVWRLEDLFTQYDAHVDIDHRVGYCGNKNTEQLGKFLEDRYSNGYEYVVEGDASGFDQTQFFELKYIDVLIYNYVKEKVYHCDKDLFFNVSCTPVKDLILKVNQCDVAAAECIGTVFSGSTDTTFMNTVRNATYQHFTLQKFKNQYDVLAKGDDFSNPILTAIRNDVTSQYDKYWISKNDTGKPASGWYGIAQIKKITKVVQLQDMEFCSNIVISNEKKNFFLVARQPDRMVLFAPVSRKAVNYNDSEMHEYLKDMAVALESSGLAQLPFYKQYYQAFKEQSERYALSEKVNFERGKRMTLDTEVEDFPFLPGLLDQKHHDGIIMDKKMKELERYTYDYDYYHNRVMTQASSDFIKKIRDNLTDNDVYAVLNEKYHWDSEHIKKQGEFLLRDNKVHYVIPPLDIDIK
jgi:hypothetical protein